MEIDIICKQEVLGWVRYHFRLMAVLPDYDAHGTLVDHLRVPEKVWTANYREDEWPSFM